jgi:hypothetical protein
MSAQKRLRERRKAEQAELKRVTTAPDVVETPAGQPIVTARLGDRC